MFYEGDPVDPGNHSLDEFENTRLGGSRDPWLRTPRGVVTGAEYVMALYDQEIRHLDPAIGDLIRAIDRAACGKIR